MPAWPSDRGSFRRRRSASPIRSRWSSRSAAPSGSPATRSDYVFRIPQILEHLTKGITLEPGDLISLGSLGGVPGYEFGKESRKLQPGDTIEAIIEQARPAHRAGQGRSAASPLSRRKSACGAGTSSRSPTEPFRPPLERMVDGLGELDRDRGGRFVRDDGIAERVERVEGVRGSTGTTRKPVPPCSDSGQPDQSVEVGRDRRVGLALDGDRRALEHEVQEFRRRLLLEGAESEGFAQPVAAAPGEQLPGESHGLLVGHPGLFELSGRGGPPLPGSHRAEQLQEPSSRATLPARGVRRREASEREGLADRRSAAPRRMTSARVASIPVPRRSRRARDVPALVEGPEPLVADVDVVAPPAGEDDRRLRGVDAEVADEEVVVEALELLLDEAELVRRSRAPRSRADGRRPGRR